MDTPLPPQDPQGNKPKAPIDIGSILLPKKETPGATVDSAQRINAGALLQQEVAAAAEGTHAGDTLEEKVANAVPPVKPVPAVEEALVQPLETYQRDIERIVQDKNVSVLSIAAAEAERRAKNGTEEDSTPKEKAGNFLRKFALVAGGIVLVLAAAGAIAYVATRPTSVPAATNPLTDNAPFISVDAAKEITVASGESRDQLMSSLNAAVQATSLSLGLINQLLVTESSTTASGEVLTVMPAQSFFTLIAPHIPQGLARSIDPTYLLGVHVYNGNQPFIIAKVDSYEDGYAGMLAWESFMQQDLMPLFNYTPSPRIPEEGIATTSTDTSNQFIQTGFVDKIVENHDARVLQNENGDIYLLWTFLDRNTLVITTNDATLREVISRLKNSPITPIPGQ